MDPHCGIPDIKGWRSDTQYRIRDDALDDVLSKTAEPATFISIEPDVKINIAGTKEAQNIFRSSGDEVLSVLPNELLYEILVKQVDLSSLFALQQTNRSARHFVLTGTPFKLMVDHADRFLGVLLKTNIASNITLHHAFGILRASTCAICEAPYAPVVHLHLLKRVCERCVKEWRGRGSINDELRMFSWSTASFELRLPYAGLELLPTFTLKSGCKLVSFNDAVKLYEAIKRQLSGRVQVVDFDELSPCEKAWCRVRADSQALYTRGLRKFERSRDATADVCYPLPVSFSVERARASRGFRCKGCSELWFSKWLETVQTWPSVPEIRSPTFFEGHFLDHFRSCQPAQALYETYDDQKLAQLFDRARDGRLITCHDREHIEFHGPGSEWSRITLWKARMRELDLLKLPQGI